MYNMYITINIKCMIGILTANILMFSNKTAVWFFLNMLTFLNVLLRM